MKTILEKDINRLKNIEWLKENSILLDTVTSQDSISDLLPLRKVIGFSTLVGLDKATHGNKEFSKNKEYNFFIDC